jgi:hypothetical protein
MAPNPPNPFWANRQHSRGLTLISGPILGSRGLPGPQGRVLGDRIGHGKGSLRELLRLYTMPLKKHVHLSE